MRERIGIGAALCLLAVVCACAAARVTGPATPGPAALERDVAARISGHRRSVGRAPLAYSETVAAVARRHSVRMASGAVGLGHDGMRRRSEELRESLPLAAMGENVSRHRRSGGIAEAAVAGWLRSAVHRRNIDGDYQVTGVGAATSRDGVVYLTQIFVRTAR